MKNEYSYILAFDFCHSYYNLLDAMWINPSKWDQTCFWQGIQNHTKNRLEEQICWNVYIIFGLLASLSITVFLKMHVWKQRQTIKTIPSLSGHQTIFVAF